jgi:hypothetical protein
MGLRAQRFHTSTTAPSNAGCCISRSAPRPMSRTSRARCRRPSAVPAPRCSPTGCARIKRPWQMAARRGHLLLPALRRRPARVRAGHRHLRLGRSRRMQPANAASCMCRNTPPRGSVDPRDARRRLREALASSRRCWRSRAGPVSSRSAGNKRARRSTSAWPTTGASTRSVEDGLRLLVNFEDYLDTGLFLDHRETRRLIGQLAPGRRFLNLFGYTGSASLHAAAAAPAPPPRSTCRAPTSTGRAATWR